MKHTLLAAALAAIASPSFGFDEVGATDESVREVRQDKYPPWLADVFEHVINPEISSTHATRKEQS
jgi:hypothetical protein